jgi:hypothetical protein
MPEIELLSASQRDGIVRPILREWLEPLGLVEVAPRRWMNGSRPPVRSLFELDLLKGASLKACWGFSLDFVPHVSGSSVRWHRSDTTARLDVIVDPAALPHPSVVYGADRFRAELREMLPIAVASARRDWEQAATLEEMLQLVAAGPKHPGRQHQLLRVLQLYPVAAGQCLSERQNRQPAVGGT